jgi:hypothetical protein
MNLTIKNKTMNSIFKTEAGAFDRTIQSLCHQIDDLEQEVLYWKERYETEVKERNEEWKQRNEETMKGVANALRFALAVSDDENGNLVISKENRKELAETWS